MGIVEKKRKAFIDSCFSGKIPDLWCPPIIQYDGCGRLDKQRTHSQLQFLCRSVKTFLLFGSTGDGWELDSQEKREMLRFYAGEADALGFLMLIGVLEPEKGDAAERIGEWVDWMKREAGTNVAEEALKRFHVCGFTVCAPRGEGLSQKEIKEELAAVLELGYPTALYQLPQITLNEIEPETVENLAGHYPNFYLFKDTGGSDRTALSGRNFGNVFLVRGAEGEYERWPRMGGGPYDGFLLSSANTFGAELKEMLEDLRAGQKSAAQEKAAAVSGIIGPVFAGLEKLEGGNVFANANKCMDHILAWGENWRSRPMPMRHCGKAIPEEYVQLAWKVMKQAGKAPGKGYADNGSL